MGEEETIRGRSIIDAIKRSGVEFVVAVPDITTSEGVLFPLAREPGLRLVRVCKEDEGVSICAALGVCGKRALLLIQNTGFLDSVNAIRAIGVEYGQPVCMMIGLQGRERDRRPEDSARVGVRIVVPILETMRIPHDLLEYDRDAERITPAIDRAYRNSAPTALLIGRSPLA